MILTDVHDQALPDRAQVGHALELVGLLAGAAEHGKQYADENGDNADDDEQLDQRKADLSGDWPNRLFAGHVRRICVLSTSFLR